MNDINVNVDTGLSEAATELAKSASSFTDATVGQLLRNEANFYRWKQMHWIFDRAEKYLQKRQAKGKKILPIGPFIRFLDQASLEDNNSMQDLWSRLLANATDPDSDYNLSKTHMSLLSEMNPLDAQILQHFHGLVWLQEKGVAEAAGKERPDIHQLALQLGAFENDILLSLGNLWRLGCLTVIATASGMTGPSSNNLSLYKVTPLGDSLIKSVKIPDTRT